MKKLALYVLSFIFLLCVTVGLVGCKEQHTHSFTEQKVEQQYLALEATCTEAAKYYYSCSCGEKGTQTFASGNALGHEFTNYVSDNNATCTKDGTKTAVCDRDGCNEKDTVTDVGSAKGHTYSEKWTYNESEHWHSATCGHNVEKDRAAHTFDESKKCTVCDYITVKPLGLELQSSVFNIDKSSKTGYLKVANAVTDYDFSDKFTVANGAKFDVCTDKQCNNKIASKRTNLVAGDNVFYIFVTNGNDVASYTLTLRRRPIYTVTFNATGGTAVNSQSIEEDAIIPEPVTTRAGYTFIGWSYDFTQPIIKDTKITAAWTANTNTAYKVEYYLENLEDNNYTLIETKNLQGTTDTTVTAEIKTYDHFTFNEMKSISSGNVSCDGSLVLKVYYTRNTYTLSNANTSYGTITNAATKKYGNDKIDSVATEYPGCEFLGWYNGEELLSTAKEYSFTVENNVTAKFKVKAEMSNFNFNSSVDTCNITGLKDKTVSEIIIPNYVTSIGSYVFEGCSGLTSVTIGNSVTSIGSQAFSGCYKLVEVINKSGLNITKGSGNNGRVAYYALNVKKDGTSDIVNKDDYLFYTCDNVNYLVAYVGSNTDLTLPDDYNGQNYELNNYAFYYCSGLTSVTIPNSVTSIGSYAFSGCNSLASITLPFIGANRTASDGYNEVFGYIFGYTTTSSDSSVSGTTYQGCYNGRYYHYYIPTSLRTVILSNGVTSIGNYAFYNCSSLTSVTIPDSVTSIGYEAFRYCYKLVEVINKSGLNITKGDFDNGCIAYYALNVKKDGTSDIVNKDGYLFYTVEGTHYLVGYVGNDVILTLPESYNGKSYEINRYAFRYYYNIISVTIPDSVTSIGGFAFSNCSELKNITYTGTIADWNNIDKGGGLDDGVPTTCVIHCTDGDIAK